MRDSSGHYSDHAVFSQLETYAGFYESLADAVWSFGSPGTTAIGNFDSRFYSSLQGTLCSISGVLSAGRINDAYALLRKYNDGAIVSVYSDLYIQTEVGLDNPIVEEIEAWLRGRAPLPGYQQMLTFIRQSDEVRPIIAALTVDDRYKRLRDRCNAHMHYNFFRNALRNSNEVDMATRLGQLDEFATDVLDVFVLHVACAFFLNDHYMASSDYIDALECGITPEPDSQYWVAPFVQEAFDQILAVHRPDVAEVVRSHTCMMLQ